MTSVRQKPVRPWCSTWAQGTRNPSHVLLSLSLPRRSLSSLRRTTTFLSISIKDISAHFHPSKPSAADCLPLCYGDSCDFLHPSSLINACLPSRKAASNTPCPKTASDAPSAKVLLMDFHLSSQSSCAHYITAIVCNGQK